jgi:hypothetical protein
MKTIQLFVFLFIFVSSNTIAQITVREKEEENPFKEIEGKIKNNPYDSLENTPYNNLKGFIGQRLLMNMKNTGSSSSDFSQKTYSGFYTDIDSKHLKVYKGIVSSDDPKNIKTDINAVYGKYFNYVGYEIIKIDLAYSSNFNIYLKLIDENNDTLYFEYIKSVSSSFLQPNISYPFITEGYYDKSIKFLKGQKVQKGYDLYNCLDVFVEDNSNNLTYKLQDSKGIIERHEYSEYSKVRGFTQYSFKVDASYLSDINSTFKGITKNKEKGSLNISTMGTKLFMTFFFPNESCFSTDDNILIKLSDEKKINEYYRGSFNCKGTAYIALDITSERHLEWLEKVVSLDTQSVIITSASSDYMIFSPKDYENIRSCIKAHYMDILSK